MRSFRRRRKAAAPPAAVAAGAGQAQAPLGGAPAQAAPAVTEGDDAGLLREVPAEPRWEAMRLPFTRLWLRRLRAFLYGELPQPVPSTLGLVEEAQAGKIGICCSGGGIRSAAFNLGALQWLQAEEELERAAYLSAVSGGSYIAAAFAMVARCWQGDKRPPRRDPDERREGERDDSDPAAFASPDDQDAHPLARTKALAKGSPEELYLRNHCSYLAPSIPDLTYLVVRMLLGMACNLVLVSLPLFAVGLLLGEYLYRPHLPHLLGRCANLQGGCKADVRQWWIVPVGLAAVAAVLALAGMVRRTRDDEGALLRTWSVRVLYLAIAAALLLVLTPVLVELVRPHSANISGSGTGAPKSGAVIGGGAGLAGLVLGVWAQLREAAASPKKAYEEAEKGKEWLTKLSSRTRRWIAYAAGAFVGPALLAAVYVYGVSVALASTRHGVRPWVVVTALAALVLFAALYAFADLTSWSLHPFYKRRLCSAFALKRLLPKDLDGRERTRVQTIPVGRQGSNAPVALERDYDRLVRLSETAVKRPWPTLLVCAAANISDQGATPPGRSVTSFTFSANTVGGPLVGAVPTRHMEKAFEDPNQGEGRYERLRRFLRLKPRRRRLSDLSLPAAVAMSGAAISPSMGKLTKRPYRFLLALANVRLGVWVPNPRWVSRWASEKKQWRKRGSVFLYGRPRPIYLLNEMIGRNRIGARYLYVTDGGHYENLGLVELLRRGCTEIYCFDASGGEGFEVLGDAIALARSELGVEIGGIEPKAMFPDTESLAARVAVKLDFQYPASAPGAPAVPARLVYARNVMTGDSPWDVQALHKAEPNFPHNSTLDQLYTDQKFEGYRVLGERAGQAALKLMRS